MKQNNRLSFIWFILYPILVTFCLFAIFGCWITATIFLLLFLDGACGLYRSFNIGKSYSNISVVKKKFLFKGFPSIMFFGIMFTSIFSPTKENKQHQNIHRTQWKEVGFILFYILYGIEFLIKLGVNWKNPEKFSVAYNQISFEREADKAYEITNYISFQNELRIPYAWINQVINETELETK